jgi:hypothetical protein
MGRCDARLFVDPVEADFFGLGCGRIQSDRTGKEGKAQEPVPIGAGCHENSQRNRGLGFKIVVATIVPASNERCLAGLWPLRFVLF